MKYNEIINKLNNLWGLWKLFVIIIGILLLFILYNISKNGRYQFHNSGYLVLDTQTGKVYRPFPLRGP
jgi:hypothetical protein